MAKLFYSLNEAAKMLDKSPDEVQKMVDSGQLQEFRDDNNELVVKKEQVDVLAGDGDGRSIPLDDDVEPISLGGSGSASGLDLADSSSLDSPKESTGISIFDVDETEEADPSAATVMTDSVGATTPDFSVDPAASGSGLLDLTREADDTSLGGDLLQDVYGEEGGDALGGSSIGAEEVASGGALFESTETDTDVTSAPAAMMPVQEVSPGWSGFAGGASLAMVLVLGAATALVIMALTGAGAGRSAGAASGGLIDQVAETAGNPLVIAGGAAAVIIVFGLLGMVIGKKAG